MKARNILVAGAALVGVAGCASYNGQMDLGGPTLTGGEWVAVGDNTAVVTDKVRSTASFDAKGNLTGNAGCNAYSGKVSLGPMFGYISTNDLKIETNKCADEKVGWQEDIVYDILKTAEYYGFDAKGQLVITAKDGRQLLLHRGAG